MTDTKVAVISTGNGGQTMAAYLALKGYRVSLYAREQERVDMFPSARFALTGAVRGEAELDLISCDMGAVVKDAALVLVTTPAQYHPIVARAMAPHLAEGQIVSLNPGRTLGTYVFDKVLRECGCAADITLCELETFLFTCRCVVPGRPILYAEKRRVQLAAHDPSRTAEATARIKALFPEVIAAQSVFDTGFSNVGMVFHPLPILMNITRVEAKEGFHFYTEGISPLVANILTRLDAERVQVARAAGAQVLGAMDWLKLHYGSKGDDLYSCIQSTAAYRDVLAPTDIDTRYIYEDILTGCVPVSCVGKALGVKAPIIDSVIQWASCVYNYDFYAQGRNERLLDIGKLLSDVQGVTR